MAENAVVLEDGTGNQELVQITPGGVQVTNWTSPYAGTITLETPLQFGHSSGASVTYVYREVKTAGKASTGDPYSEALQSQAAQLALAHLPPMHVGLTRNCYLNHYPIITIRAIEHSYSFDSTYNPIDVQGISIEPTAGFYRFRIGTVITPEGLIRTTYTGGYSVIPDDIKEATMYYLADEMQRMSNPYGAVDVSMGKRRTAYTLTKGKTPAVQMAEAILDAGYRRRI